MLEKHLRPSLEKLLILPLAGKIPRFITPFSITLSALLIGCCIPLLAYFNHIYWAIFALLISGYLDVLDGSLARLRQQSSARGSIFDIISDRVVEFSAVFALYLIDPAARGAWCLLILGSFYFCITVFLVSGIFTKNTGQKSFHYSPGIIERAETFIFIIAILLIPSFFNALAALLSFLVILTAVLHWRSLLSRL